MNFRRLVSKQLTELVPELGRIRMPVLFDGMAYRHIEDFLLRAGDGYAAVAVAGHPPAIDHLAGRSGHKHLEDLLPK